MRRVDPITDYLSMLAAELAFDPRLAERVCDEVADHLWEAAEQIEANSPFEAQRLAIASIGSARNMAAQYLPISLISQAKRVGRYAIVAIAGIIIGMRGCSAWYEMTHGAVPDNLETLELVSVFIDRGASLLALGATIFGWAYITFHGVPSNLQETHSKHLNRSLSIFSVVTAALILSIGSDAFVIGLRVSSSPASMFSAIPVFLIGLQATLAAILCRQLWSMTRLVGISRSPLSG